MELPKLHIGEQHARALLAPLVTDLAALESRTARHATRLRLTLDDQARLDAALRVVQQAHAEVARLWDASQEGRA